MKKVLAISLIVISLLFNVCLYSYAATVEELQQQKDQAQKDKDRLEQEKEEVNKKKSEAMKKIEELDAQIQDSEDKLEVLRNKVKELEVQIKEKESEITQTKRRQEEQETLLEKRLIAKYKNGKVSYWSILLNPSGFLDFFSNMHNIEKIAKIDSELIESIIEEKENLERAQSELLEKESELKTAKVEAEQENAKLKSAKVVKNSELAKLSEEEKQLQSKIDEFNAAIKKADEEMKKQLDDSKDYVGSFSGTLSWPISTTSYAWNIITSGYGKRDQPTAGASTNHKALDIGIRYQPIYAPADGYVVTAQSVSGYGNFIMIKHSNSLYTCYGHLSSYNVSAGQTVKRGQQIAISGNTGVTTGPHLHFEVRTNGTSASRVNPLNYIPDSVYAKLIFR